MCSLLGKNRVEYETDKFNYNVEHTYLPDFRIVTRSGKIIFIETKGNGRAFDHSVRVKMINVRNQNKDLDIRLVFYSDGKIGPNRKDGTHLKQSDWAIKHGFKFSIRSVPEEWINE